MRKLKPFFYFFWMAIFLNQTYTIFGSDFSERNFFLSPISFASINTINIDLAIGLSEEDGIYFMHDSLFWLLNSILNGSKIQNIHTEFGLWKKGKKSGAMCPSRSLDSDFFRWVLDLYYEYGDDAPYYQWYKDHEEEILVQCPILFRDGNMLINPSAGISDLNRFRLLLVHEKFQISLRGLDPSKKDLLKNFYEKFSATPESKDVTDFLMKGYEMNMHWEEFFAQILFKGDLIFGQLTIKENSQIILAISLGNTRDSSIESAIKKTIDYLSTAAEVFKKFNFLIPLYQKAVKSSNAVLGEPEKITPENRQRLSGQSIISIGERKSLFEVSLNPGEDVKISINRTTITPVTVSA